jgi:hypothetical protein
MMREHSRQYHAIMDFPDRIRKQLRISGSRRIWALKVSWADTLHVLLPLTAS